MTTIKTDQETGVQTILNEQGKAIPSDDTIRDEKIEEAFEECQTAEDLIKSLTELNCSNQFIAGALLDKFNKFDIAEILVEVVTDTENKELDSALQCIQANFNVMETQINLHRKCGNTTEAGILQGMLDLLVYSSKDMIELKAKRDKK